MEKRNLTLNFAFAIVNIAYAATIIHTIVYSHFLGLPCRVASPASVNPPIILASVYAG